jgi:hypothetical protein
MTTLLFVGAGNGLSYKPLSSATWTAYLWGAGQAGGNDGTTNSGHGAYFAKKNSFPVTSGTPVSFQLGAPGTTNGHAGGDTWLGSPSTVIAPGGGSATTAIGDVTHAGGAPGTDTGGNTFGGAGGAGGPSGAGQNGGNGAGGNGGCGGGGNGGGTTGNSNSLNNGGNGGSGVVGGSGG